MIDHNKLISLAQEYGSPLYVYDGDMVLQRYIELHEFINWPKLKIYYAMKANYNPSILKTLAENGAFVDAVSPAEVQMALRLGFPKERILYTANNLTEQEMHEVAGLGVLFNIGSLSRLEKYGAAFPNTEVCLRFNPDVVAGEFEFVQTGGDLTKFGILRQDVLKVKEIVARHGLRVVGLHEHTGSGIAETDKVYQSMGNLLAIAKREDFPDLRFIDFGGGFKVPYKEDEKRIDYVAFGRRITEIFSEFCNEYGREIEMCFEPGKYIVAESGYLVVQVNTLKNNNGRLIAGTNSGFPQLIRPVFYDAYHKIVNASNPDGGFKRYDVAGNICETGDVFASDRELREIREGDFLVIENAGAYCYSMGGVYNLRPMPAEIFVFNGDARLSRRRLSNGELINQVLGESQ
ncbi:diaminopimelate decarboxylase [archaeon]